MKDWTGTMLYGTLLESLYVSFPAIPVQMALKVMDGIVDWRKEVHPSEVILVPANEADNSAKVGLTPDCFQWAHRFE
jgi:hypothetical protein